MCEGHRAPRTVCVADARQLGRQRPRGDCYGAKGKRKADNWGKSDKASREAIRRYNVKKDKEREERQERKQDEFERRSMAEDHPQRCPVCLERLQSHLVANCGQLDEPGHRGHGYCETCAASCVNDAFYYLCMGPVQTMWPLDVSFFA
eukprot:7377212-Prymnesium_polylepis.1